MKYVLVIPARFDSTRFPGKPLYLLDGLPMIIRTYNQCIKAVNKNLIYVATDDLRIETICKKNGINVILTRSDCKTGTDRVAEVAKNIKADFYINVQGDEPLFNPSDLKTLIDEAKKNPESVINGYAEINSEKDFLNPNIPKVVFRPDGSLLYMSRASIPSNKKQEFLKSWRQVCAYVFPRKSLLCFARSKYKTELEKLEDIEILRFLEMGIEVKMVMMSPDSISVDTIDDANKVENILKAKKNKLKDQLYSHD